MATILFKDRIYTNSKIVRTEADLASIDSTKVYIIDGEVPITTSIVVPSGGLTLLGNGIELSGLVAAVPNLTMFTGGGNFFASNMFFDVPTSGSKLFGMTDPNGTNAVEFNRVNFNNCVSLGYLQGFRQGFESGTGRFGGTPELEFRGTWSGGYRMNATYTRGTTDCVLFKAGASFTMASRFYIEMNVNLSTLGVICDFTESNLPNKETLEVVNCVVTRGGTYDLNNNASFPNITPVSAKAFFRNNIGLVNTYIGGINECVTETATTVGASNTWYDASGVYICSNLDHFTANGALPSIIYSGGTTRRFAITGGLVLDSNSGNVVNVRFKVFDGTNTTYTPSQRRVINNLQGARDVAYFDLFIPITLQGNTTVTLQVMNETAAQDITIEQGSYFTINEI